MMQKRTNPLELKVENRAARAETAKAAPVEEPVLDVASKAEEPEVAPKIETLVKETATVETALKPEDSVVEDRPTVAQKPALAKRPPVATQAPEQMKPSVESAAYEAPSESEYTVERAASASSMGGAVQWQMVSSGRRVETTKPTQPVVETKTAPVYVPANTEPEIPEEDEIEDVIADDILEDEQEIVTEPVIEQEDELYEDDDLPEPESSISDEEEPLVLEDYEMAARFLLCGRVSRGMKIGKLSRDLCRLAQLMHPNESLSSIIEGALLTRIYLENRDAFDAMVEMLAKKGGHIKC